MNDSVTVRYPPSPTGLLHIGTVRTCLYNYLFAKKNGGRVIMRLEDTDRERSSEEYAQNIMDGLKKLGIIWDEGPYRQTERTALYRRHLESLIQSGKAYYCFCTPEELAEERAQQEAQKQPPRYGGKCAGVSFADAETRLKSGEKAVIRFRVPLDRGDIAFTDLVRGEVQTAAREIADFVIAKDLETPLYNFTVVVDDHEMGVSHVIRGEDHIPNTPKQVLLYEAFGWQIPQFAHLPLILNADRSKLSKRKNKVSVDDYLADGILPEALINFLALIGWNTADEQEIFSLEELVQKFSLERVQKGGAIFDHDRLLWLNGVWIRSKPLSALKDLVWPFLEHEAIFAEGRQRYGEAFYEKALSLIHERLKKLTEASSLLRFFYLPEAELLIDIELFSNPKMKVDATMAQKGLRLAADFLRNLPENKWNDADLQVKLLELIRQNELKNGQVLWPLRVALTGEAFSPGAFEVLAALGKERSLIRMDRAIELLQ